ncbi:hypothetical protein ABT297_39210 [Dactylosporangium sp. NPDC000555]|uniref:hypothetical protein n=1 Tax=Dactylosporangium sp. NPDC000555 TaxID=3154260 RepID=UPI003332AEC6
MGSASLRAVAGIAALLGLAGCGGAGGDTGGIPGNKGFVEYRPAGEEYAIKVPEGWTRTEIGDTATFTDRLNTITVTLASSAAAPTTADGTAELDALAGGTPGFAAGPVSTVQRRGGTALLVTYRADAPADPVTGRIVNDDVERYEFWYDRQLLIVTLAGPYGSDNVDPWRTVTDSVRWLD